MTSTAAPLQAEIVGGDALRRRRYRGLPPREYLTPGIVKAAAEADRIAEELRTALHRLSNISSGGAAEEAAQLDRDAAVAAIRAGKPVATAGTPATEALLEEQRALGPQIEALAHALVDAEGDVSTEFAALDGQPKLNGQAALTAARTRYRKAVTELCAARQEWAAAAAIAEHLRNAARSSNWTGVGPAALVRLPVPPNIGIRPENMPLVPFDDVLADLTAEVTR